MSQLFAILLLAAIIAAASAQYVYSGLGGYAAYPAVGYGYSTYGAYPAYGGLAYYKK